MLIRTENKQGSMQYLQMYSNRHDRKRKKITVAESYTEDERRGNREERSYAKN